MDRHACKSMKIKIFFLFSNIDFSFLGLEHDGLDSAYALWSRESESWSSSCEESKGLRGQGLDTYSMLHVAPCLSTCQRSILGFTKEKSGCFLLWCGLIPSHSAFICFHISILMTELVQMIDLNKQFQVRIQWSDACNNWSKCMRKYSATQPFLLYHSGSTAKMKESIQTLKNCLQQCKESVKNPFKAWRTIWSDPSASGLGVPHTHITSHHNFCHSNITRGGGEASPAAACKSKTATTIARLSGVSNMYLQMKTYTFCRSFSLGLQASQRQGWLADTMQDCAAPKFMITSAAVQTLAWKDTT
jgi:hypothetical protein